VDEASQEDIEGCPHCHGQSNQLRPSKKLRTSLNGIALSELLVVGALLGANVLSASTGLL